MTIKKEDMRVNNQGHIFQSGDQTTTCIFTALLDLDSSRVRAEPLFSMQITQYYIDCLICLKSIWYSHFRFGGVATQSLKCAHPSPWKHSIPPKGYLVSVCTSKLSNFLWKSEISVYTLVWVMCLHRSTQLQNILHGHLWLTERWRMRGRSKRKRVCVCVCARMHLYPLSGKYDVFGLKSAVLISAEGSA